MVKYRPSKSFALAMLCMGPPGVALYFGLLPELEAIENPPIRGEIRFRSARHAAGTARPENECHARASRWSLDWLEKSYEDLMSWDKNPWKTERLTFGSHYFKLLESKNPRDQARAKELRRLADALHQRVLERFPELAVADKNVPPERNGFLKWLEFAERLDPDRSGSSRIGIPDELQKQLKGEMPWVPAAAAARAWLAGQQAMVDEIRAIGLMPEQSIAEIEIDRWAFQSARLAMEAAQVLMLDARLAAESGDAAAAMESIQAAKGLAAHFGNVETPSLLMVTVQLLLQAQVESYALTQVMPALPAGQLDPAAWESAVNPAPVPPSEYARIMRGEWNVEVREYLMPMLSDTEDPKYPPDPDALIDHHAGYFLQVVQAYEGRTDWLERPAIHEPDDSHLSRQSRELTSIVFVGERAWNAGLVRAQSRAALTRAAFAIMQGQPVPSDPVYGLPYAWDAATRTLSPPVSPEFQEMQLKPVIVPRP